MTGTNLRLVLAYHWYDESLSGTMYAPSTESRGEDGSMSSAGGFLAKTSVRQGKAKESTAKGVGYGARCGASLARYDHDTSSWRTPQGLLFSEQQELLETWPKWGMWDTMECWARTPLALDITEPGCGWWPTPERSDYKQIASLKCLNRRVRIGKQIGTTGAMILASGGGKPNPSWIECLMGWPIGWTELKPLATDKFQQWQRSHGKY